MPHRGNAYQSIIFAAQQALDETGELPRTNAALAALSGLDEAQVSNIFRTKADIYEGLLYQATTLLNDALRQGVIDSATDDPVKQMLSIGRSYLSWADHNPVLFRLIANGLNGEIRPDSTLHRFTISMRDLYRRKLTEMQRLGILSPDTDIELAMLTLHCLVKGGNMMFLTRATDPWFSDDSRPTAEIAERIFIEFLDSLTGRRLSTAA
ncbi:hypothetical protein [Paracoccus lutimaris]|uniref:TetR family transcriptional regulator n=1 Tax=Paracoccus lutimaris TaxID=1490030 RepID=A0A368Z8T4_9RHOB|nr:hypothetical protein [Paracoccus lutimaris]RCW88823.1 hypothetical protein DFP89_101259 [Paracoccus lutimaris]